MATYAARNFAYLYVVSGRQHSVDAVAKNAKALIIVLLATKSWTYTNIMGGGENEKE